MPSEEASQKGGHSQKAFVFFFSGSLGGGRKGKTKIKGSKNRKWLLRRLSSKKNLTVCVKVRA